MRLQVKVLHFVDGIGPLGGTQTISRGKCEGGPRQAEDILRVNGGYLVKNVTGGRPGSYFVPDARVACAQVEEVDDDPANAAAAAKELATPPAPEWTKPALPSGGVSGGNLKPAAEVPPEEPRAFAPSAPGPLVSSVPPTREPIPDAPAIDLALIPGHTLPEGMKVNAAGVFSRESPTPPVQADSGDLPPPARNDLGYQPSRRRGGPKPAES